MLQRKHIRAPLRFDPGKGHATEHLAYLNRQEMELLRQLTDGEISRGPRGLPSFAITTSATGPASVSTGGGSSPKPSTSATGPGGMFGGSSTAKAPASGGAGSVKSSGGSGVGAAKGATGGAGSAGVKTSTGASPGAAKAGPGGTAGSVSPKGGATAAKPAASSASAPKAATAPKSSTTMASLGASKIAAPSAPPRSPASPSSGGGSKTGTAKSSTTMAAAAASAMAKAAPVKAPGLTTSQVNAYKQAGASRLSAPSLTPQQSNAYRQAGLSQAATKAPPSATTGPFGGPQFGPKDIYKDADRSGAALRSVVNNINLLGGTNQQKTDAMLRNMGYQNPFGRAGMLGTFGHESEFDPNAEGDKNLANHAYGLAQWRMDRWDNAQKFAQDRGLPTNDIAAQAAFAGTELANGYRGAYNRVQNADSVEDAVRGMNQFEAPKGYERGMADADHAKVSGWGDRVGRARDALGLPTQVAGMVPGAGVSPTNLASEYAKGKTDKGGFTTASDARAPQESIKTPGERVANAFAPSKAPIPQARPWTAPPVPQARPWTAPPVPQARPWTAPPVPTGKPPMQGPVRNFAQLPNRQDAERARTYAAPVGPQRGFANLPNRQMAERSVRENQPAPNAQFAQRSFAPSVYSGYGASNVPTPASGPYTGYGAPFNYAQNGVGIASLPNRQMAERSVRDNPAAPNRQDAERSYAQGTGDYSGYGTSNVPAAMQYGGYGSWPSGQERVLGVETVPGFGGEYSGYGTFNTPQAPSAPVRQSQYAGYGTFNVPSAPQASPQAPAAPVADAPVSGPVGKALNMLTKIDQIRIPSIPQMVTPEQAAQLKRFVDNKDGVLTGPIARNMFQQQAGPIARQGADAIVKAVRDGAAAVGGFFTPPAGSPDQTPAPNPGFQYASTGEPASQKDQSRVPQETSPDRADESGSEEGRRVASTVASDGARGSSASKRAPSGKESASDNRKATGGPGGGRGSRVASGVSNAYRAQGLSGRGGRIEPIIYGGGARRPGEAASADGQPAIAPPGPIYPSYNYFQNVRTREEALRQLLGEEWYA